MIGTKVGKTLGPALYESSGNGALYAAISASLSCLRLPWFTIFPQSKSSTFWLKSSHCIKPSVAPLPTGRPEFDTTSPSYKSGYFANNLRPMRPPQS